MTNQATLTDLFKDLGPLLGNARIVEYAEEGTWVVELAPDIQIVVERNEGLDHLVLSADVGEPPSGDRLALYEMLLTTNGIWRETGGLRFAVAGEKGAITQLLDVHAGGLEPQHLHAAIVGFAERLVGWRSIVEGWETSTTPADPSLQVASTIIKA